MLNLYSDIDPNPDPDIGPDPVCSYTLEQRMIPIPELIHNSLMDNLDIYSSTSFID